MKNEMYRNIFDLKYKVKNRDYNKNKMKTTYSGKSKTFEVFFFLTIKHKCSVEINVTDFLKLNLKKFEKIRVY